MLLFADCKLFSVSWNRVADNLITHYNEIPIIYEQSIYTFEKIYKYNIGNVFVYTLVELDVYIIYVECSLARSLSNSL